MTEEIFGPILPVLTVDGVDAAIAHVNAGPKPLAAYVFTGSSRTAERVTREVPAGATVVNHLMFHVLVPRLPFGGVGRSGSGAYHGRFGFETFSHRRAVLRKPARPDPGQPVAGADTDVRPTLERVEMTSGQVSGGVVDVGGGQDQMIEHLRDATGDR